MRGPIDYIVVGFNENNFSGRILEELLAATKSNTIKVLEIALIVRDDDGNVSTIEATDPQLAGLISDLNTEPGLYSDEDMQEVGELLEDGTSAGLLIIEHTWAKGLKRAMIDTGGVLISEGRIHPDASKELDEKGDE